MSQAIEIELSTSGTSLYIFFGGIANGIAIPPFEFYNSSKIINENKIFIRDFYQCWYQNGLPGISEDIPSTVNYIKCLIEEIMPEKIFFIGNSMGGYAAILFANLIGKGEAIVFAPQTFISPGLKLLHNDFRWMRQIIVTYRKTILKNKFLDLRRLLLKSKKSNKISVFVSMDDRLDYIHALHIKNIPGVNVYEFDGGGHEIVKLLRDKGKLPLIMSGNYV